MGRSGAWRSDMEKVRKEGKTRKRVGTCVDWKKRGKKKEGNVVSEWRRKKRKKKVMLLQYFHNKY